SAEVVYEGDKMTKIEEAYLRSAIGNSSHPLSRIIYQFLPKTQKFHLSDFEEKTGAGFTAVVNATTVKVGSAIYTEALQERPSLDSVVYIQVGKKRGLFIIKSSYRKGIFKTLKELAGRYKLALLSGDNSTENKRLSPYFDELQFDQKPEDKYHYLAKLKEPTLMVGDGLNDAGALKKAAVGVAVSDDIHQFSPACDAILRSDKTTSLFALLKYSKKVRAIVQAAFVLSFLYNIIGLSFAVSGNLTPLVSAILMPLSSVTVVVFITCCVTLAGKKLRLTNSL
ncbi:MAG: HAD-IC family P-type ATPase, partial [Bacteroidota bacterium]